MRFASLTMLTLCAALPTVQVEAQATSADSLSAVTAVAQFHTALSTADSARAVSLLAADVMILESGAIQTRAEYLSHHLGADMKASAGSKAERTVVSVTMAGPSAIVVSKSVTPASGAEGSTASEMAELMVLSKVGSNWQIRAIHWSSRRRRA